MALTWLLTAACLLHCGLLPSVVTSAVATQRASNAASAGPSDGDGSNRCDWLSKEGSRITRFSVLPGGGWDNLRNRDMGLVADLSFRDCALSDDGTYVTPSHVILYPKRESQVSLISHVMEHYENYTSTTSLSINLGGNGIFHGIGIDGKFSEEFQQVKKTALSSRTQIGRTQQRYNMYTAQLQPDFRLSESFANRLTDIGNALINNQTKMARYLSDLLVRDFGTHVVTSVDAGAVLEKVDYFNRNALTSSVFTSNKLSQCLSVSFANVFGLNYDMSLTTSTEEVKQYINSVQQTSVNTHGGPPMGAKINLSDWEARLRENLIAMDKIGEPLFGVISERSLTQIPLPHLKGVIDSVKDAVMRYYKANEVKGCQDPNSPNFEPLANIDGACQPSMTNFSFAGVFQTCQESNPELGLGLCGQRDSPVQKNPITGDFRCPEGYEAVKLLTLTSSRGTRCYERRKSCWLVLSCHDRTDCYESVATLSPFWCAAVRDAKLAPDSGMVYGGAYSPRYNNPATDARACGAGYRPYTVGRDISLCLSADMQLVSLAARIPLAGFFTCQSGNPLAESGRTVVTAARGGRLLAAMSPPPAPKRCPDGFGQSAIDILDGCELMQCARVAGSELRPSVARRPPFEETDFRYVGPPVTSVEAAGRRWAYNGTAWLFLGYRGQATLLASTSTGGGVSGGAASIGALVALLAVLGLAILAALGFAYRRRWLRRLRRSSYRRLDEDATDALVGAAGGEAGTAVGGSGYGSVNSGDDAEVVMEAPTTVLIGRGGGGR